MPLPPPPTPSWDCILGTCIDPGTGLGAYPTLAACLAACSPPPPPPPPPPPLTGSCTPSRIVRGRHTDFRRSRGIDYPAISPMGDASCADALPDVMGLRHIGFTPAGLAIAAYAWQCCDVICTDEEVLAGDCYKRADCWPYGEGPGITKRMAFAVLDVSTCWSGRWANCVTPNYLYYDGGELWTGTLRLRGGVMTLSVDPCISLGSLRLTWSCAGQSGFVDAIPECLDPLSAVFQFNPTKCCDCNQDAADGPFTQSTAQLAVYVMANCRKTFVGRHVTYIDVPADTGTGTAPEKILPVIAKAKPCATDQIDCYTCANMQCPVVAEITAVDSACAGIAGVYGMNYDSGLGVWANLSFTTFTLSCEDLSDGRPDPDTPDCISCDHVRLTMRLVCGADNVFTFGTVTVPACDLENLDVTFTGTGVSIEDPAPCCVGTITVRVMRA